nr:MAG TPA: hypothetical protein [Caudoviricetes sp.]
MRLLIYINSFLYINGNQYYQHQQQLIGLS